MLPPGDSQGSSKTGDHGGILKDNITVSVRGSFTERTGCQIFFLVDQHFQVQVIAQIQIRELHPRLHHTSATSGHRGIFCSSSGPLHIFHWNHLASGEGLDPEARAASGSPGFEPGLVVTFAVLLPTAPLRPYNGQYGVQQLYPPQPYPNSAGPDHRFGATSVVMPILCCGGPMLLASIGLYCTV